MLALTACDKPIAETILIPCCDMRSEYGPITIKIFNTKHAIAIVHGNEIKLTPTRDYKTDTSPTIKWDGIYNDTAITIYSYFDTINRLLTFNSISTGEGPSYGLNAYVNIDFPEYKAPTKQEICMNELKNLIHDSMGDIFIKQNYTIRKNFIDTTMEWNHKIPHDDAIKINPTWEKTPVTTAGDACATLDAIKTYISKNNIANEITVNWSDITCASPKKIHLGCNDFENLSYTYMQLNICDDGRHILIIGDEPDNFFSNDYIQMTGTTTPYGIEYAGTSDNIIKYKIRYYSDDNTYYAQKSDASGMYTICDQAKLDPNQICARKIHNQTILNPDNTVALDIYSHQEATENGYKAYNKYITLTQEQALKVSKNWDYKNIKLYTNGNEPHEQDACAAWLRLNELKWEMTNK